MPVFVQVWFLDQSPDVASLEHLEVMVIPVDGVFASKFLDLKERALDEH